RAPLLEAARGLKVLVLANDVSARELAQGGRGVARSRPDPTSDPAGGALHLLLGHHPSEIRGRRPWRKTPPSSWRTLSRLERVPPPNRPTSRGARRRIVELAGFL